jgi:MFS family permease
VINGFVGAMVGLERAVLPLLGESEFGLGSRTAILAFVASFGATKALANLAAGALADRAGRRPVLLWGWLIGLLVPVIVIAAPTWGWIVFANALLGVNQGLCWSTTVIMKVDLVGPARRGLALGVNEFAGYIAVGLAAFVGAQVAATTSLRPEPFALGAIVAAIGALLSLLTRDTAPHVRVETIEVGATAPTTFRDLFADVSWRRPALFSASQAGLANNLNDGVAWGLLPLFFMDGGLGLHEVGILAAVYPGVWGLGQIASGALSDKIGRRPLIATGMVMQACALAALVPFAGFGPWVVAMITLGVRLPDAPRGDRRRRASQPPRDGDGYLPLLARCGLRRRCPARGSDRRSAWRAMGDRGRRRADARLRDHRPPTSSRNSSDGASHRLKSGAFGSEVITLWPVPR